MIHVLPEVTDYPIVPLHVQCTCMYICTCTVFVYMYNKLHAYLCRLPNMVSFWTKVGVGYFGYIHVHVNAHTSAETYTALWYSNEMWTEQVRLPGTLSLFFLPWVSRVSTVLRRLWTPRHPLEHTLFIRANSVFYCLFKPRKPVTRSKKLLCCHLCSLIIALVLFLHMHKH